MSGTVEQAFVAKLNEEMRRRFGDRYVVLGNVPDDPKTLVIDRMGDKGRPMITQVFDKNQILEKWMAFPWYQPYYSNAELEDKKDGIKHRGFLPAERVPSIFQGRAFKEKASGYFRRTQELFAVAGIKIDNEPFNQLREMYK